MAKALLLAIVVLGLDLAALASRNGDVAWLTLPFLAYLVFGIWQAPLPQRIRLSAARSISATRADGTTSVDVKITVANEGIAVDRLVYRDALPSGVGSIQGPSRQAVTLQTGEAIDLQYRFQAKHGHFAWTTIKVTASDALGLIDTEWELPAGGEVQVPPEIHRVKPFPIHPQDTVHSAGSIPARLGGSGTDFWGVREYHTGDSLHRLDWRRTARYPGRLFSKEFEQEEITNIGLLLDARPRADVRLGEERLFEHAAHASASLAEVFLRQGNRVSLLIYGQPSIGLFPGYGKVQLNRILRALTQTTSDAPSGFDSLEYIPVRMFPSRSLIIVLSPLVGGASLLTGSDWHLFPRLRAMGYQVLLISPDPFDYAQPLLPADPAGRRAARLARIERYLHLSKITPLGIPVIDWQVDQPLSPLVREALRHGGKRFQI
jgi:uncharacterized protein (DUF58 family)